MSIRYGVFVSTAVLTFGLASTVFCRGRTARCVMQEPTIPGRGRVRITTSCFQERRRNDGWLGWPPLVPLKKRKHSGGVIFESAHPAELVAGRTLQLSAQIQKSWTDERFEIPVESRRGFAANLCLVVAALSVIGAHQRTIEPFISIILISLSVLDWSIAGRECQRFG
jgi:hypothetical protein